MWTLYAGFAYILAAVMLTLVTGWRNWGAIEGSVVAGGPVLYVYTSSPKPDTRPWIPSREKVTLTFWALFPARIFTVMYPASTATSETSTFMVTI
jgi:hypothetical protein